MAVDLLDLECIGRGYTSMWLAGYPGSQPASQPARASPVSRAIIASLAAFGGVAGDRHPFRAWVHDPAGTLIRALPANRWTRLALLVVALHSIRLLLRWVKTGDFYGAVYAAIWP